MAETELPKGQTVLSRDERWITAIYAGSGHRFQVGLAGCTSIVAYDEMQFRPWLAIYHGEEILARVPADLAVIYYEPEHD